MRRITVLVEKDSSLDFLENQFLICHGAKEQMANRTYVTSLKILFPLSTFIFNNMRLFDNRPYYMPPF